MRERGERVGGRRFVFFCFVVIFFSREFFGTFCLIFVFVLYFLGVRFLFYVEFFLILEFCELKRVVIVSLFYR